MRKLLLTLFISIFCVFNMSAQIFITPNNGLSGETLQVFISGNSPSEFFHSWSQNSNYLFLGKDNNSWDYQIDIGPSSDAYNNWQYNSSIGSYGFYANITIPAYYYYVGNYNLYVDECQGCGMYSTLANNVFVVNASMLPHVDNVWPDDGEPGEYLSVSITGGSLDLGPDQWTPTSNFRFSQFSGTNAFYGTLNYWYDCNNISTSTPCQYIYGHVNIPNNQPSGDYDLEVWDQTINDWVMLANAFEVLPPQIDWIDPDQGNQGQTLSVTISGYSMDYGGQWSGTNLSDFRFSQWSGSNMFYGTSTSESGSQLYGDVSIPNNQPGGYYDLEVWDYGSNQWIMKEDAFEVVQIANMFTPNNGLSGETLQVFISGNSPSEFFHSWSQNSNYLFLGKDNNSWDYQIDIGPSSDAYNNWQYNSSIGSYGFYANITIPAYYYYVGNYNLYVDECQGCGMYSTLANNVFVVNASMLPHVDNVWPDDGEPGEYLSVSITGGSLDLGPDQWTPTSNFRFSQFSGTNAFYGTLNYWYDCNNISTSTPCQYIYGHVNIPNNQPSGDYDLEVWDQTINDWVMLANAFEVLPPQIDWIDPDQGNQGQTLSVTISGYSMDYGGQWSGTNLSDFRFSQWSGSNMFYGTSTSESGSQLYGDVSIPNNQPGGYYDLEVWDYGSNQWIMKEDAFEVVQIANMFTPNNGLSGETLQVFISGNSPSEFFHSWSQNSNYLFLGKDNNSWDYQIDIGPSSDAYNNWQYNSSIGSYGFYANITIPAYYYYVGNYNLYVDECQGCGMYSTLANNVFVVNASMLPHVDNVWPDDGEPGEYLSVSITGGSLDLGPDQWTPTSNFRFSQFSGTNAFYGTLNYWYDCNNISTSTPCQYIYGHVNIPNNQPSGDYDLEVWDQTINDWVMLANAFEVLPPQIDWIDPDQGNQGQTLSVTISGYSMDYGGQWSGTNLSDFRFSQWSGSNMFYGTSTSESGSQLYGDVSIPNNQPGGYYDLEVWDYGSNQWIMKEDAFEVIQLAGSYNPIINTIYPNSAGQGDNLSVSISGSYLNIGDQWSPTSSIRFTQYSGTNTFYGNLNSWYDDSGPYQLMYISANVNIPSNQQTGYYDVEIWDQGLYQSSGWVTLQNGFEVTQSNSISVTPNQGEQGQNLQVFISGDNINDFIQYSSTLPLYFGDCFSNMGCFSVPNNAYNWQWNWSVGSYGFYTNIQIPANQQPGSYNLTWEENTNFYPIAYSAFTVTQSVLPEITSISPNSGDQGQTLSVTISGNSMDYGGQWSGTNLSDFRFSQWSGSNMFYGNPSYESGNYLYGDVSIPSGQNPGYYDLEVYDNTTGNWIMLNNAFEVNQSCYGETNITIEFNTYSECMYSASNYGWELIDENGGILASGGTQAGEIYSGNSQYYYSICIPDSCATYSFVGYDNSDAGWWDLDCWNWLGSATITDENGNALLNANPTEYDNGASIEPFEWSSNTWQFSSSIQGCTDPVANNYDPLVLCDDGSCCYGSEFNLEVYTGDQCGETWRMGWQIQDNNGNTIASGGNQAAEQWYDNSIYNYSICITDSCESYNLVLYDDYGNSWNYCGGNPTATLTDASGNVIISYSADGECCWSQQSYPFISSVEGCTDPTANNFNPNAQCDDGSCCFIANAVDLTMTDWTCDFDWACDGNFGSVTMTYYSDGTASWNGGSSFWTLCGDQYTENDGTSNGWQYVATYDNGYFTGTMTDGNSNSGCWLMYPVGSVLGCTDSLANNYNSSATLNDGSCCYVNAFNLDINTNEQCGESWRLGWEIQDDNGNIIASGGNVAGESYSDYTNYNYDICITDSCAVYNLILYDDYGNGWDYCGSATATLTDPDGNIVVNMSGNCCWSQQTYSFSSSVQGCTDPSANNYNPNAQCDDGSCCYTGSSYNLEINTDNCNSFRLGWEIVDGNGTILYSGGVNASESYNNNETINIPLCLDASSCDLLSLILYDQYSEGWEWCSSASAVITDQFGNVIVIASGGSSNWSSNSYDFSPLSLGCTDPSANNYDSLAICDDGSCCYVNTFNLDINTNEQCGESWRLGWEIQDDNGNIIASGGNQAGESYSDYTNYNYDICITDSCAVYNLILYDDYGNGWDYCGPATATLTDPDGNIVVNMSGNCCWSQQTYSFSSTIQGCTDPSANNYNSLAVCDDGSCCYLDAYNLDINTDECNAWRLGWEIQDDNGNTIASGGNQAGESYSENTNYNYDICITDSCAVYNLILYDDYGNGWDYCGSATATLTDPDGNIVVNMNGNCCWSQEAYAFSSTVQGCTDPSANNYDVNAQCDDGSCCYSNDPFNLQVFTPECNSDNIGWEIKDNYGNIIASGGNQVGENYNDLSIYNYNICLSTDTCLSYSLVLYDDNGNGWQCGVGGSVMLTDPNGNIILNQFLNCCWTQQTYAFSSTIQGCTDPSANNYNSLAVCDDGSCCYLDAYNLDINTDECNAWRLGWEIQDDNGNTIASGGNQAGESYSENTNYNYDICITDSCAVYNLILYDDWGEGWDYCGSATATLTDPDGNIVVNMNGNCCWSQEAYAFSSTVQGCTDPSANNYNSSAVCDDGSCCYDAPIVDITQINWNGYLNFGCDTNNEYLDQIVFNNDGTGYFDDNYYFGDVDFNWELCGTELTINWLDNYTWFWGNYENTVLTYNVDGTFTGAWDHNDPFMGYMQTDCITIYSTAGCTDPIAYNYSNNALSDNGTCEYCTIDVSIIGIDPSSVYSCDGSAFAIVNNNIGTVSYSWNTGSAQYFTSGLCGGVYNLEVTDSVGCTAIDSFEIIHNNVVFGCTDILAVNYNSNSTIDDGTCIHCDLDVTISSIDDLDPVTCNEMIIAYATSSNGAISFIWSNGETSYLNQNLCSGIYSLIISDEVGCSFDTSITIGYIPTFGCTDPTAVNYNPNVNTDDGSCIWLGCTDATADNYDAIATVDDGSCTYTTVSGCTDPTADNYDATATVDDGSCIWLGCTDPAADNYDALATVDDGSCSYTVCTAPSPAGAYVTELTHDRVRFNWDDMNSSTCMVEQYRIRYREAGTSVWSSKTMSGSGLCQFGLGTTSKMTLNLQSSTTYEYYMKAWYCGGSSSGWSALQNFTTEDDCQNVINFTVSTPTPTKATFAWDTVSAYSFVRLQLRVDTTGATWFTAGGFGVFYPDLTKSKNGLVSGESYRASARTWCNPNGGPYRSATWSTPIFWTQPTSVRIDGGAAIANLDVYPNPSRDVFNVAFTSESIQDLRVRILNVVGEVIISEDLAQFVGEYTKQINLKENAKGIYFLEIETNDGVVNKKLILQ